MTSNVQMLSIPIDSSFSHYIIFLQSDWLSDFEYSCDLVILTCLEYPGPESKKRTPGLIVPLSPSAGMYLSMCTISYTEHVPENVL